MGKYRIENCGCDDSNLFDIELTDEELKIIIKLFEENNKCADCYCTPHLYIYKYDKNKDDWEYTEDLCLNRDYKELNKEEK